MLPQYLRLERLRGFLAGCGDLPGLNELGIKGRGGLDRDDLLFPVPLDQLRYPALKPKDSRRCIWIFEPRRCDPAHHQVQSALVDARE
jgi:hypothetical protein